jgi:hypothetical protein
MQNQDKQDRWYWRLQALYAPILAMIASLILSFLVISSNPFLYQFRLPNAAVLAESLLVVAIIGLVGGAATLITFFIFRRGGELLHRIVIAVFVSPIFFLLTVFIGEAILLLIFFQGMTNLVLSFLAMASIFFASMSVILILSDAIGTTGRNVIFTMYGIILGVFLGTNFTWYSSLALLAVLAAEDTLFATKLGPTIVEADPKQHARTAFTFVVGPIVIGIGDLVVYAALVAYSFRFFGWIPAWITIFAILIGCLLNTIVVSLRPNKVIPGLPIPLLCALVPILISLTHITLLGLGI